MKTIGIIGGSTDIATAEYYRIINATVNSILGGKHTAKVLINSMDCAVSDYYVHHDLWDEGGQLLKGMVKTLEQGGAELIICVSNTWHRVSDVFMQGVGNGVRLLHIADVTARAVVEDAQQKSSAKGEDLVGGKGLKIGLLGTKATMSGPYLRGFFKENYGFEVLVPSDEEQMEIDRVIFEELARAVFREEAREFYLKAVDGLIARGARAVVLGCTEIPLLVRLEERNGVKLFDTLRLHAEAAARLAVEGVLDGKEDKP
jgi:aspartate racemase